MPEAARALAPPTHSPAPARQPTPAPAPARSAPSASQPGRLQAGPAAVQLNANTPNQATIEPEGGEPLAPDVRRNLERSFGVDLRAVRVHTDERAQNTARSMDARAFTIGTNIFLGPGERPSDLRLLAHEVAHVVQQRSVPAVQRWSFAGSDRYEHEAHQAAAAVVQHQSFAVRERTTTRAQRLGISDALDYFADVANNIPGFTMLTFVLGFNPINMRSVERNATNLFRAIIGFLPGGNLIFQALQRHGIIDQVGAWLQQQLNRLGYAASSLRQALDRFLDSLGWRDIFDLGGVWDRAKRIFTEPIDRITSFLGGVVSDILRFIRDAILRPVARLAEGTRGYDLLRLILGEDPITGDPYPRTAENMIGGFMRLIGQEEKWQYLQQSRAIPRAWAWFQQQVATLLGFVQQIPQLFVRLWESLQISDLLDIVGAFNRVRSIFGGFVSNFISWAGNAALQIMMFIFEVLAPGAMPVLRRAAAVIRTIISDPIRFVRNLVRAGVQGFRQFAANIRTHLINGLVGWLTSALSGAGLQLPARWDLRGILSLVLQILGLTWQNIRQKLVRVMGEPTVTVLERTFDIVVTLVREGPAAAWQKILENLGNLQEMVFGQIREWVIRTVVGQAIIRIASMLNPAGAVIQAIIAIYNTIMFFRERLQQIIQVAEAFFNSIAEIANGAIGAAANYVERTMGRLVPVVISFLARLIGLGGISNTIRNIIARIRAPIDRALDRVVEWIAAQARRLGSAIMRGARNVAGRVTEWWRQRRSFTNRTGESHELSFQGTESNARLMIASEENPVETYLDNYPDKSSGDYRTARSVFEDAKRIIFSFRRPDAAESARRKDLISTQLARISAAFARLSGEAPRADDYPRSTDPSYTGPPATENKVEYIVGDPKQGSIPGTGENTGTPGWQRVYRAGLTRQSDRWVQMHVISEKLGGKGQPNNLISAPGSINTGYFRSFELATKNLAKARSQNIKNVVWVKVAVTWRDSEFANTISGRAGLYVWRGPRRASLRDKWQENLTPSLSASATVPRPDFHEQGKVSLNFSSGTDLRRVISDAALVDIIKNNRPYSNEADFRAKITGAARERGIRSYAQKINGILANSRIVMHDVVE